MTKDSGSDSYLLALELLTQQLKKSMVHVMQKMQHWNMNPPQRNQPQQWKIEYDLGDEYDDPSI